MNLGSVEIRSELIAETFDIFWRRGHFPRRPAALRPEGGEAVDEVLALSPTTSKHMSPTTPTTAMPKLFVHAGVRRQPDGTVVYFDAAKRIGDVFVSCGVSADWLFPNDVLSPFSQSWPMVP